MTEPYDFPDHLLSAELLRAFDRHIAGALDSLAGLRQSMRDYVVSERMNGADLDDVIDAVHELLERAVLTGDGPAGNGDGVDHPLSRSVPKWCAEFFAEGAVGPLA